MTKMWKETGRAEESVAPALPPLPQHRDNRDLDNIPDTLECVCIEGGNNWPIHKMSGLETEFLSIDNPVLQLASSFGLESLGNGSR